jgi:hypothetical protein
VSIRVHPSRRRRGRAGIGRRASRFLPLLLLAITLLSPLALHAALHHPNATPTPAPDDTIPTTLPDWWKKQYFPSKPNITENTPVPWSDGRLTCLQAFQQNLNPIDYYEGHTPKLKISSGDNKTGPKNGFAPYPLMIAVTDKSGNPLPNAPVTFKVTSGGGQMQRTSITKPAPAITVLADETGQAKAFFLLPDIANNKSQITVSAGPSAHPEKITLSETSDNGSGATTYYSPFSPSNAIGHINSDGSEDDTWENNTDPSDKTPIPVWYWDRKNEKWFQIDSVPAGTTSYHVRPNPTPMPGK